MGVARIAVIVPSARHDRTAGAESCIVSGAGGRPSCPACAAPVSSTPTFVGSDRLHGTPGHFSVHICNRCGTGLTLPAVRDDELTAFYPSSYNAYALPANRILRALARVLFRWRYWRALRRPPLAAMLHRPPGRLLDVGGGRGDLGVVLRRRGWSVTSLDPSDLACAEARSRGVDSVCGTLSDPPDTLGGGYDAVAFQHSLEHVVDPAADLAEAHDRLAGGGLLIVTLPNFNCWQRRSFGADWFHLDVPRHRSHFSPAGLQALLRRCGFETIWLSTSTSADGLAMSVQYRWLGRPIGVATGRYVATAAGLVTAPLTAVLSFVMGGGDILHAQAIKPAGLRAPRTALGKEDQR